MKLNIRVKMLSGFIGVIVLLVVVAVISYNGLNTLDAAVDHIVHESLPEVEEVADLKFELALQTELFFEYGLTLDDRVLDEADRQTDIILEEAAQLEEQLAGEPELLALLLQFEREYEEFLNEADLFVEHYREGDTEAGLDALHIMVAEEADMEAELTEMAALIDEDLEASFESADAAYNTAVQLIIAVSIIASIVALAIALYLSRAISNGVTTVANAMQLVSVGDITAEVKINSSDELGDMAVSYGEMQVYLQDISAAVTRVGDGDLTVDVKPKSANDSLGNAMSQMVTNMRDLIGQVGQTANGVADASSQLNSAAEQAGSATQAIASSSQQMAKGAEDQSQGVEQTTTAMQQLTNAIDQIARGSQEQAGGVEQTSSISAQVSTAISDVAKAAQAAASGSQEASEAANSGKEMVDKTVEGMGRIRTAVEAASVQIADLGTQSDEIGKIVAVIDDIAAQTNLLALNAAIEAARAGEQGRGFAVVADEVRGLAERVTESVKAVGEGTTEVEAGVKLAEDAGGALDNILTSVESVADQITQISASAEEVSASSEEMIRTVEGVSSITEENSAAAEQMSSNSGEVAQAIESISSISEQNSAATQEVSASAEEMTSQMEEVIASSQSLAGMAEELQAAVGQFKLTDDGKA